MNSLVKPSSRFIASTILLLVLAIAPVLLYLNGTPFYLDLATRLVCLAIAAVSLNLVLGYGGMVSFGHAAFIGLGAYAVGIPAYHFTYGDGDFLASYNGFWHIFLAVSVSSLFALITGAICLRTKGVHFIMITMAFAQMAYYLLLSQETYGGDDGLVIDTRSEFPLLDLSNPLSLYGLCFVSLLIVIYIVYRLVNSRFGMVIQGAKDNDERMNAMGYNTYSYRLLAYVISGALCGYAGVLLGNFTTFISPEMMGWTRSGELMFMVILGGSATLCGPVLGAALFIMVEYFLKYMVMGDWSAYWHLPFGLLLILSVAFVRGGLMKLFTHDEGVL